MLPADDVALAPETQGDDLGRVSSVRSEDVDAKPATRRRAHTRRRLVAAAWEVFAESGLAGTSVEAIVERAGFTRGAFYSNFTSKEDLLLSSLASERAQWLVELTRRADELLPDGLHGAPTTAESVVEVVVELLGPPEDVRREVMMEHEFRLLALRDPALGAVYARHRAEYLDSLAPLIAPLLERAGLRPLLPLRELIRQLTALYDATATDALLDGQEGAVASERAALAVGALVPLLTTRVDGAPAPTGDPSTR